jgi:hypothetical protein
LSYAYLRQEVEQGKHLRAFFERAQSKFCDDKGMDDDLPLVEMPAQVFVARAQMVDPD